MCADWELEAACRDLGTDFFFPTGNGALKQAQEAKRVCRKCPVQMQCLQTALARKESNGVWGGLTASERKNYSQDQG